MNLNINLTIPQNKFLELECPYPAFVAGYGCVEERTEILTAKGFRPISEVKFQDDVVSWNEKNHQFQLAPTSGAFPKGKGNLYRVVTTHGEFVANEYHQICVSNGVYEPISNLCAGSCIYSTQPYPLDSIEELDPVSLPLGVQNYWETLLSSSRHYEESSRLYGQLLHHLKVFDPNAFPLLHDARKHELYHTTEKHTHFYQHIDHKSKTDYLSHALHPVANVSSHTALLSVEHTLQTLLQCLQFQTIFLNRQTKKLLNQPFFGSLKNEIFSLFLDLQNLLGFACSKHHVFSALNQYGSCSFQEHSIFPQSSYFHNPSKKIPLYSQSSFCYSSVSSIIHIEKIKSSEWYWDIHVAGNHNYITRDGTLHHNSGKSEIMCVKALLDSLEGGSDSVIALYEPTYDLVKLILKPRLEQKLIDFGIRYKYNKSDFIFSTSSSQVGDFILRSMDNPERIVGYESFRAGIDEIDTLKTEHADMVFKKIIARNRQKPRTFNKISNRAYNSVSCFSTPEGYRHLYQTWIEAVAKNPELANKYQLVQASSYSNPFLPDDYLDNLLASYPPNLAKSYIMGEFVNLTTGNVYKDFDRKLNHCDDEILDSDTVLFVGADFNVGACSGGVMVYRNGEPRIVDELINIYDTPELIEIIKSRYWKYQNGRYVRTRQIVVYPDASSNSRKTVNASVTDMALLQQAGFVVEAFNSNPPIINRVNSYNALICNGKKERRLKINTRKCPSLTDALERQAWGKNGLPEKGIYDNRGIDGTGYMIYYRHPINFNRVTVTSTSARR